MRRGDRLFQIVQLLRTHKCITARQLSERLEVSERTIYRDMQDLSLSSVPIISETGSGYSIDPAYSLPPITFNENELESLLLGARMVQAWSDRHMAAEATRAIEKIECILPHNLKPALQGKDMLVPDFNVNSGVANIMPGIRQSIKQHKKINLHYQRADGEKSVRTVWPLGLFFWGKVWTMVGWCEARNDFRQFRLDRIGTCDISESEFKTDDKQTLEYFLSKVCNEEENKKV